MKYLYGKRIKIVKSMALPPRGCQGGIKYAKKAIFSKIIFCFFTHVKKKISCIVMMSMKSSTTIVKLMGPGSEVQALAWG